MHRLAIVGLTAGAFIAAYILLVGALVYASFGLFDPFLRRVGLWQIFWSGYAIVYSPAAAAALLAAWYSRLSPRGTSVLLAVFMALTCVVIQWTLLQKTGGGSLLIGELGMLSVVFFAITLICRRKARMNNQRGA
jgi:hypothetical protein